MFDKLESIHHRFLTLEEKMADPEIVSDMKRFMNINKEYKDLKPIDEAYHQYKEIKEGLESTEAMLKDPDPEMKEMAKAEFEDLQDRKEKLDEDIKFLLIPKDPDDKQNAIIEIRSGTGGDEAAIFAGDLYRMYMKFFETQGWKTEVLYVNEGSAGGYSKVSIEVKGDDVYGRLKFESGAHRVQRVPRTESQGRVHTSAATVAIMPIFEMEDIDINKSDLKTDTFRASGAGGQHVNKTESGVRFTHLPTGIVAESTDGRSQIKNRDIAMGRLYQKIREAQKAEFDNKVSSTRKSLVGSGDRSDKIRTYNYPQNRVTDHRINLTLYSLDKIIEGNIEDIIDALVMFENAEKMKEGLTV